MPAANAKRFTYAPMVCPTCSADLHERRSFYQPSRHGDILYFGNMSSDGEPRWASFGGEHSAKYPNLTGRRRDAKAPFSNFCTNCNTDVTPNTRSRTTY